MSRNDEHPSGDAGQKGRQEARHEGGDEGFLDRWSRRKAALRRGEPLEPTAAEIQPEAQSDPAAALEEGAPPDDELNDAELAERYGVPDPASLGEQADYSAYMKQGVPDRLRNIALRKLWRSSPDLACLDGLLEYGEDYTGAGYVGVLQTAYEVGAGFAKRIEAWEKAEAEKERAEQERFAREQAEAEAERSDRTAVSDDPDAPGAASAPEQRDAADRHVEPAGANRKTRVDAASEYPVAAPIRRRMQFRFDTNGAS